MNAEITIALFSFFVSIAAFIFSLITYKKNRKLSVKPVLVFLRRTSDKWEVKNRWTLRNVGNGPALNILLGEFPFHTNKWNRFTDCYPISVNSQIDLNWLEYDKKIAVAYEDVDGKKYTTTIDNNKNYIKEGHIYKQWPKLHDECVINEFDRQQEGKN